MDKKGFLLKIVQKLEESAEYADACFTEHSSWALLRDSTGLEPSNSSDAGVKLRAFDGTRFCEECVPGWNTEALTKAASRLSERVKAQPKGKVKLDIDRKKQNEDFNLTFIEDPSKVAPEKKIELVEEFYNKVSKRKAFVETRISYREEHENKVYVNKYKQLSSKWTGVTFRIIPFVQSGDTTRYDFLTKFGNGFEVTSIPEDELEEFFKRAQNLRTARRIEPGKYTVVSSPEVAGLLAHESFGHGMEGDTMMHGRAKAQEYLGKKIAPAKVNICEDASLPSTHGFLFFDDEGMQPQKVFLVERGIVKQPITDMYSATKLKTSRTANGRAESYDRKIYARMTNTFFLPGKEDPQKMIKDIKDGWYLHTGRSGMEDPKGWGVQIAGITAERISKGKLTGELACEVTVSGFLPEILGNIKAVGKEFRIVDDAGFCGKGHKEWVRVSSGGAHLLIEEVELS